MNESIHFSSIKILDDVLNEAMIGKTKVYPGSIKGVRIIHSCHKCMYTKLNIFIENNA